MKNQNIIQNSPDAIYTCDQKGFIKSYNKAAVNLWGREPVVGKDLWCGSWKIFDKNGGHLPVDQHPMAIALREGRLVHGEELIVQRPDGSMRYVSPYSSPLVNAEGHLTGVVSMMIEVSEQKNRERLSEEKYRNLIEQAADGIFLFDLKGDFVSVNTSGAKMLGYDIESLLQLNIIHILPLQFIDKMPLRMATLNDGHPLLVERIYKRKDGSLFYAEVRAQMVLGGNIQAIVRDITERKKAEAALKESEIFNKSVLTSISSHIAVVEENGEIISVNKAWENFSTKGGECLLKRTGVGTNYIEVCKKSVSNGEILAAKALDGFYKVMNGELPIFEMEYPCDLQNEKSWFLLRITKFADNSPKVVMMHIDISARVKAAATMRQALERYDMLAKATSDTIWDWDITQNRIRYNNGITQMFGYEIDEIENLEDWWKKNIHPADLPAVSAALEKIFSNKAQNFQIEYRFRCENGTYKYVFDRASVIFDDNEKPVRMIGAMQDITDRKKTEQDFRMMKRALMNQKVEEQKKITRAILNAQEKERRHMGEELHDNINQMLAGTKLYLSVAGNGNAQLKEALQYPIQLIDETMTEIRLLTKRSVTPKQNVNLKELLQTLVDTMFKSTAIKTCFVYKIVNECLEDELKLNIYRILQEQTNNIMKHACAANVNIAVKANNNVINIMVTDDGNGFDTSKKREGIGISNIINRVESFNGEVVIESAPGNGCKLLIKIPY
ncbi:PAS domain S-box protein [Ferruginibacter sp. SUN106]|uniref:PAS domain S-box protein n=1 Tax=Ferruginibacter sp. SUN106 TaxID=2978348 RepID=UPI003D35D0C6